MGRKITIEKKYYVYRMKSGDFVTKPGFVNKLMRTQVASHPRDFEVSSLRLEFRYVFHFYKNDTNLVIINYFPL